VRPLHLQHQHWGWRCRGCLGLEVPLASRTSGCTGGGSGASGPPVYWITDRVTLEVLEVLEDQHLQDTRGDSSTTRDDTGH